MAIKLRTVLTHLIDYLPGKVLEIAMAYAASDCINMIKESLFMQEPIYIYIICITVYRYY